MKSQKRFKNEITDTVIGENSTVKGAIHSQRSVRVEGFVDGEIHAQGEVYIGQKSKVKASITGRTVIVAGEVTGNIEAVSGLHIASTGKVYGDISGDHLIVEEGGIYRGHVNMDIISSRNPYEGQSDIHRYTKSADA